MLGESIEEDVEHILFNLYAAPAPLERSEIKELYNGLSDQEVSEDRVDEAVDRAVIEGFLRPLGGERINNGEYENFTKYGVTSSGEEIVRAEQSEKERDLEFYAEEITAQYLLGEKPLDDVYIRRKARERLQDEFGYEPSNDFY